MERKIKLKVDLGLRSYGATYISPSCFIPTRASSFKSLLCWFLPPNSYVAVYELTLLAQMLEEVNINKNK